VSVLYPIAMTGVTPERLIDVLLAPFVVLGITATFGSGCLGALALITHRRERLGENVNLGLAVGFMVGAPLALPAFFASLLSG
jgi:hypothetical protein